MLTSIAEVLWTARYDYQPHWKLLKHRHDYFQMIYFLSGSGSFFLENCEHPLREDLLFLIKPRRCHGLVPLTAVKTLDLKFVVRSPEMKKLLLGSRDFADEKNSGIPALFEQIRWEGERKGYLYRELCDAYLVQILLAYLRQDRGRVKEEVRMMEEKNAPVGHDPVTEKVLSYIKAHYAEELDSQQIARSLGVSDRYLRQRFKASLGLPPMHYLLRYRVEKARDLINYSDYALKVISELAGFKSIHHFTRAFHEVAGLTPGAWRRRYQEGICKDVCIDPRFSNVIWTRRDDQADETMPSKRGLLLSRE